MYGGKTYSDLEWNPVIGDVEKNEFLIMYCSFTGVVSIKIYACCIQS
jgi:hypothetical protein